MGIPYGLNFEDREGGEETYRVQVKFDPTGKQTVVYIKKTCGGAAKVRILLDTLCLHRKYNIRVSLSSDEKVNNESVRSFVSSAVKMAQPGVIDYNPTASQEKWRMYYMHHQQSERFIFKDLYTIDISSVGQYQLGDKDQECRQIEPKDFERRYEVELHYDSLAGLDTSAPGTPAWTPETVMNEIENGRFLQKLEEINEIIVTKYINKVKYSY